MSPGPLPQIDSNPLRVPIFTGASVAPFQWRTVPLPPTTPLDIVLQVLGAARVRGERADQLLTVAPGLGMVALTCLSLPFGFVGSTPRRSTRPETSFSTG